MKPYKILLTIGLVVLTAAFAKSQDSPNLYRYQAANARLKDSIVKVVYMGDSVTDFWLRNDSAFFKNNHYTDRGISGQTSPQMLLRFRQDVIDLHPKAVVILCGATDVAV